MYKQQQQLKVCLIYWRVCVCVCVCVCRWGQCVDEMNIRKCDVQFCCSSADSDSDQLWLVIIDNLWCSCSCCWTVSCLPHVGSSGSPDESGCSGLSCQSGRQLRRLKALRRHLLVQRVEHTGSVFSLRWCCRRSAADWTSDVLRLRSWSQLCPGRVPVHFVC